MWHQNIVPDCLAAALTRGRGTAKHKREDTTLKITLPARLGSKRVPDLEEDLAAEIAAEIVADPIGNNSFSGDDNATPPPVIALAQLPPLKKSRTCRNREEQDVAWDEEEFLR